MNLFYSVWDYLDEALFDKPHTSDCVQFGEMFGMEPAGQYATYSTTNP